MYRSPDELKEVAKKHGMSIGLGRGVVGLSGNTFPHKEAIKSIGLKWNGEYKCWMIQNGNTQYATNEAVFNMLEGLK